MQHAFLQGWPSLWSGLKEGQRAPGRENKREMRSVSGVGRIAAIGAVVAAIALVAIVLFGGAASYSVKADFVNAGQLVKGNPVQIGGVSVGSVGGIKITDDGQAEITLKIKDAHAPLPRGTQATIRQFSLSGIANRYVDLRLPNGDEGKSIPDGGRIGVEATRTAVDLDQLFNTLDPETRKSLQGFFKGNARQWAARGEDANKGLEYLNPALATSSRLFNELTRDTPVLERFLVDSSRLVTALAERRDDLAGLIGNLNDTTRALGDQKQALADSIGRLPPFMRRANTTFVNVRSTLDQVDPLVNASKPVAKQLGPFLKETRDFTAGAKPTLRDLSITIRRSGASNDLIELLKSVPPLEAITVEKGNRSVSPGGHAVPVGNVRGAFPEASDAFKKGAPQFSLARNYTPDFLGWLDDFSTTGGGFDALGATARAQINFSENIPIPQNPVRRDQFKRCPGSAEAPLSDGSNVLSQAEMDKLQCQESARATGDVN
jgi:phospholipid/cholesterol/gamma-HCH transport system substrate-binding protein